MQDVAGRVETDSGHELVEAAVDAVAAGVDSAGDPVPDVEDVDLAIAPHPEQPRDVAARHACSCDGDSHASPARRCRDRRR